MAFSLSHPLAWAQQSADPSHADFYSVRLYMGADETLYHMQEMNKTMGGSIRTDEQESVFVPKTRYTRSIIWETDHFTLIADLLQHRKGRGVGESVVGISLHPKFTNRLELSNWFQNNASRFGAPTFASKVGPDAVNTLYFCQTKDGRHCEGEEPMLIVGHNFLLLSDCGYVDRVGQPPMIVTSR